MSITAGSDTIELVEDVNVHSEQIVLQADTGNRRTFEPIQTAFEQELARIGPEAMKRQRIEASNKAQAKGVRDAGVDMLKGIWGFTVDAADAAFTGMVGGDDKARDIYSTLSGEDVGSLTERNATVQGAIQTGKDAWAYGGDIVSGDKSIGDAAREASQWAYDEYLEPFVKQQENRRKLNPLTSSVEEYYEAGRNDFAADMVGVDIALTVVTEGAGGAVFKGIKKGTELAPDVPGERKIHGKGTEEEGTHSGKDKDSDSEDGSARPHPDEQDAPAVEAPTKDGKLKTNAMPRKNPLDELEQIAKRIRQMMEVLKKEPLFVQNELGLAGGFGVSSGYSLNSKIAEIWKAEGHGGGGGGSRGEGTGNPKVRIVDGKKEYNVNGKWLNDKQFSALRQKSVRQAWKQEKELVETTGKGSRDWTPEEKQELLQTGKVKGYEGQHMKSASEYPDFAGDPDNIQFLKGRNMDVNEHLDAHGGNYHNPTNGYYDPRTGKMIEFGDETPWDFE
ncbi:hypothetical protein [Paenibacillus sp. MMS18-CY102]|uniref:hypothetical protein n=1 Tax=Paenibacillus sp. MMS18-CY102 TaxID=2682849 RepID=UPI001F2FF655|nr:hypothetical protein [Paenibacillus sp. MMS18-CY102]